MTLDNAPWALDGARIPSRLARTASYIESGGVEGVVSVGDLKVRPLDVPGVGLQVDPGAAILLNRYQTAPNQSYAVTNQGIQTVDAVDMPPANAAAQSHLVCVTIGDPEFSQAGHPWMTSDPIADPENFQYVRIFIVPNVPSGTTSFKQLGSFYPALALARIDVPANTSTITSAMIVDLRKVARPRRLDVNLTANATASQNVTYAGGWQGLSGFSWSVDVPEWATKANVRGSLISLVHENEGYGQFRIAIVGSGAAYPSLLRSGDHTSTTWHDFIDQDLGGYIDIPSALRGTTVTFRVEAQIQSGTEGAATGPAWVRIDGNSQAIVDVTFTEGTA